MDVYINYFLIYGKNKNYSAKTVSVLLFFAVHMDFVIINAPVPNATHIMMKLKSLRKILIESLIVINSNSLR